MPKDWVIAAPADGRDQLASALRVSPIVAQVLCGRGITGVDQARQFLEPRMLDIFPPEALAGTGPAAERIVAAIEARQRIVLYGDYDVDGITGVAILWHCLKLAGAEVDYYIPHRIEEGYGINVAAIEALSQEGARLIISVDCGVTAIEAAARAKALGVELIITDHHAPHVDGDGCIQLPDALLVHSGVAPAGTTPYPNPDLSGSGVAFKLAWAIAQRICKSSKVSTAYRDFLRDATGLAALGIVADVVPLTGENRVIAYHGLRGLVASKLPGIAALIQSAKLTGKRLDGYDIGFKLAPRLNAIGRMGHARLAVEMLTRANAEEAIQIAENLEQQNRARQTLERRISAEARQMVIDQGQNADGVRGIVLASEGWHAGVIGIVASRITEEFGRPTVMIALENGAGQGSARSVKNLILNEVLRDCGEHLLTYGGHAMAAGLRIVSTKIDDFRNAFQNLAAQLLTPTDLRPKLYVDDVVRLGDINQSLVQDFGKLEPFGAGNREPRLATEWLDVVGQPRTVGNGDNHLQVQLSDGRMQIRGIAFGMGKLQPELMDHRRCRAAFRPTLNEWNGRTSVEMQIVDFQFPTK